MVRDPLPLRPVGGSRAHVHALVDLHGVAGNDLPVQLLGQLNGQTGLSAGRSAYYRQNTGLDL